MSAIVEEQEVDCCLAKLRAPPAKGRQVTRDDTGVILCRDFMEGVTCREGCPRSHADRSRRPACEMFAKYGVCIKGVDNCWFPHHAPNKSKRCADEELLALHSEVRFGERLVARCREIFGSKEAVVMVARANCSADTAIVILLRCPQGFDAALRMVLDRREMLPALDRVYMLAKTGLDEVVEAALVLDETTRVNVRGFPKPKEKEFVNVLEPHLQICSTRDADYRLDFVTVWEQTYARLWDCRAMAETDALVQRLQTARVERQEAKATSRAYWKLLESLERRELSLDETWTSVDIGAAPGGWTQVLNNRGSSVIAIDPAILELDPMPANVRHMQMKSEEAVPILLVEQPEIRLIVCDANVHPEMVVRLVLEFTPLLSKTQPSYAILTLKNFCGGNKAFARALQKAQEDFVKVGWTNLVLEHLFANSTEERTIWATMLPENIPAPSPPAAAAA